MKAKLNKIEFTNNITKETIDEIETNKDYKEATQYNVDYLSISCDYIQDTDFQDKIEKFGAHYFLFYVYLKTLMLNGGKYYILNNNIKRAIRNYSVMYCCDFENVQEIFEDLKATKTILFIENTILGDIVTDAYVIYNYRLTMEKRAYNRKKKREEREKEDNIPIAPLIPTESFDELFREDEGVKEVNINFDDYSEEVF